MIIISLIIVAKIILYVGLFPIIAIIMLFPINDKPTTLVQWGAFVIVEVALFLFLFTDLINIQLVL